jgi:RimJ/RimL family protein N-acetyltransferase
MIAAEELAPPKDTARLRLRPPRLNDALSIAALADDIEVARMTTGIPHPYPEADAEAFLRRAARLDPREEALFAVDLPGEGAVGLIGFHTGAEGVVEIGFWLGRPFWGRGYMSEAVLAAMDWARATWGRRWMVSGHFVDNPASGRVLIKAGFLYTGEVLWRASSARGEAAPTRMMVWLA